MKHRGKIVEYVVKTSRFSHQEVADEIKKDRRTLSTYYKKDDLSLDIILKIGKFIGHDFSNEIPELLGNVVKEPSPAYAKTNASFKEIDESKKTAEEWKQRYFDLLEKHQRTLTELNVFLKMEAKEASQKRPNGKNK